MNYIYTLTDPLEGEVRYVGKTINPTKRYSSHCYTKTKTYVSKWIQKLKRSGHLPTMEIVEEGLSEDEWEDRERFWIEQHFKLGCKLTNVAEGGRSTKEWPKNHPPGYYLGYPYAGLRKNEICHLTFDIDGEEIYNFTTLTDEWMGYVRKNKSDCRKFKKEMEITL